MKTNFLSITAMLLTSSALFAQAPRPGSAAAFATLTGRDYIAYDATFSEGNTLKTTAIGKTSSLYAKTMYQVALSENGTQHMRNLAHAKAIAEANSKTRVTEANARAACCRRPAPVAVRPAPSHYSYGRPCGYRSCNCGRNVSVYRTWCSTRRAYRYRSHCFSTGRLDYFSYLPPSNIRWHGGFGPY